LDVAGDKQRLKRFGSISSPVPGDIASFSGAGPNQLDEMKPDILAPGGYVVGALASSADPRRASGQNGMFDSTGACNDSSTTIAECPDGTNECLCYVADNRHGVAVGTSMASPIVAGAVALLFEGDPKLTQEEVRRYIQAGAQQRLGNLTPEERLARRLTLAQEGPGLLDVNGALAAQANDSTKSGAIDPAGCWLSVATGLVHPDDHWAIPGALHLRDAAGGPVSIDSHRIKIVFTPGLLLSPIQFESYGYYTFSFTAGEGTGRRMMDIDVQVDGQSILKDQLYIGVDVASARGEVVAGHGCSVSNTRAGNRFVWGWLSAVVASALLRRRRSGNRLAASCLR
jgi:MYXO-CTERM domain-containing protein